MTMGTLTLASICPGGDHVTVRIQIPDIDPPYDGVTHVLSITDLSAPITAEEVAAIAKTVLRIHLLSRTPEQLVADLQAGIDVSI